MTRNRTLLITLLLVSLVLAGGVSMFASASPDGLEKVAEDKGISEQAKDHDLAGSPLADYGIRGVGDERLSGSLAGIAGVGITFLVAGGLMLALRRRKNQPTP